MRGQSGDGGLLGADDGGRARLAVDGGKLAEIVAFGQRAIGDRAAGDGVVDDVDGALNDHGEIAIVAVPTEDFFALSEPAPLAMGLEGRALLLAQGFNRREIDQDPLAHAEILAIRRAAEKIGSWRLIGCTMYVTLEPCAMCAGALVNSRISTLVYGAKDPKAGYCGSLGDLVRDPSLNHRLVVRHGVSEEACGSLLKSFFAELRKRPKGKRAL